MNGERKEIDQFVCVMAEQMRAHDLIGLLIDQDLETGLRLADSLRRVPAVRLIERFPESNAGSNSLLFTKANGCYRRNGKCDGWNGAWTRRLAIALQQICSDDFSLITGHRSQRRIAAGGRVTCRINRWIRDTLK